MSPLLHDHMLHCLDELRAAVKLLRAGAPPGHSYAALDLGLAVCAGLARQQLAKPLVTQFVCQLCDALAAEGCELEIGLVLPAPSGVLAA